MRHTFVDSFSALPNMTKKQQGDISFVLRALYKAGKFSVFEATENDTIAATMTRICQGGYIETDETMGYPWTRAILTPFGLKTAGIGAGEAGK